MPFLFVGYVIAYLDRINVGFAGLQMTKELGFNDEVFGFGLGIFYFGYMILGIPGAMLVERWSARRAMAITLVIWGLVASACAWLIVRRSISVCAFCWAWRRRPSSPVC